MAPCRSPPRPRSTSGSPEPRGRTWRTCSGPRVHRDCSADEPIPDPPPAPAAPHCGIARSEEHTSELQSLAYLVCRLLLEKKKKKKNKTEQYIESSKHGNGTEPIVSM